MQQGENDDEVAVGPTLPPTEADDQFDGGPDAGTDDVGPMPPKPKRRKVFVVAFADF